MTRSRVDDNHRDIVQVLRDIGAEVTDLSAVGKGCPDLLVSYRGQWHLIEVKDGRKPPSARRLTQAQVEWHARQNAVAHVVENAEGAIRAIVKKTDWRQVLGDDSAGIQPGSERTKHNLD